MPHGGCFWDRFSVSICGSKWRPCAQKLDFWGGPDLVSAQLRCSVPASWNCCLAPGEPGDPRMSGAATIEDLTYAVCFCINVCIRIWQFLVCSLCIFPREARPTSIPGSSIWGQRWDDNWIRENNALAVNKIIRAFAPDRTTVQDCMWFIRFVSFQGDVGYFDVPYTCHQCFGSYARGQLGDTWKLWREIRFFIFCDHFWRPSYFLKRLASSLDPFWTRGRHSKIFSKRYGALAGLLLFTLKDEHRDSELVNAICDVMDAGTGASGQWNSSTSCERRTWDKSWTFRKGKVLLNALAKKLWISKFKCPFSVDS